MFFKIGELDASLRKHPRNLTLPRTITRNQVNNSITSKIQNLANQVMQHVS